MKEKIVTIIPSLYEGGAEKFAADLSVHLSKVFDHTTITYNRKSDVYTHSGRLIELDIPKKKSSLSRLLRQLRIVRKLRKIKIAERPKIAISHMLMANMLNILSRKEEITVCVLHGEWSVKTGSSGFIKKYVKKQYAKADQIISVSNYIKEMFDDYFQLNVPHDVIHVGLPLNVIREKADAELGLELPKDYVVYVAGFRPVKNHLRLLEEIEDFLKSREISLLLVGDGPLREEIEQEIKDRNLENKVLLLGNLSNPYPVVKNARVSLMVSSSESFSLVVAESMALGVPVISTDCGGPREILAPDWKEDDQLPSDREYGILISTPSKWVDNMLSEALEGLLDDKAKWEKFSKRGKERAEQFRMEHAEKKYEQLILKLLAKKAKT